MKPELSLALARNKFLRDRKKLRDQLNKRFGLSVEISADSFDDSVPLAQRILAELKNKSAPKLDTRCSKSEFEDRSARVFDELGRHSWMVLSHWQHVGAIQVPSVALESKVLELLHFDGDTIFGCDEDFDPDYGSGVEYHIVLTPWR
jgi:hypothetical protein